MPQVLRKTIILPYAKIATANAAIKDRNAMSSQIQNRSVREIFNIQNDDLKRFRKTAFSHPESSFKELFESSSILGVEIGLVYFDVLAELYRKDKTITHKVGKSELHQYAKYLSELKFSEKQIFQAFWSVADRNPYDFEIDYFLKPGEIRTDFEKENSEILGELQARIKELNITE